MWCSQVLCFCGSSVPQCGMSCFWKEPVTHKPSWLFYCLLLKKLLLPVGLLDSLSLHSTLLFPLFQTFIRHLTTYQNGNNLTHWRPYFQRNSLGFRYFDCNIISLTSFIKSSPAQFAIIYPNIFQQNLNGYFYSMWYGENSWSQVIRSHSKDFYQYLVPLLLKKMILMPFNRFIASLLQLSH